VKLTQPSESQGARGVSEGTGFVVWDQVPVSRRIAETGAYVIYALVDPRDETVRYVGVTSRPLNRRLAMHLESPTNIATAMWFRELDAAWQRPDIRVIEPALEGRWEQAEMYWIAWFQARGKLYNVDPGGRYRDEQGNVRPGRFGIAQRFRRLAQWELKRGVRVGPTVTLRGPFTASAAKKQRKAKAKKQGFDPNGLAARGAEASARQMAARTPQTAPAAPRRRKRRAGKAKNEQEVRLRRWGLI
jgi:hypothetical protein